jgi:Ca2+-binding EF-hand superfamily protein
MDVKWYQFIKHKYDLEDEELQQYILAYNEINNSQLITADAMMVFLNKSASDAWTLKEVAYIISHVNLPGASDTIACHTFVMYMIPICHDLSLSAVNIRQLYDIFDKDKDGFVSVKDFSSQLVKISQVMNPNDVNDYKRKLQRFIRSIDVDHDNKISYEEFKEFVNQNLVHNKNIN